MQSANIIALDIVRICTGCGMEKSFVDFYKRNNAKGNYQCKVCENKKNKEYQCRLRNKSPEKVKEYTEKFIKKNPNKKEEYNKKYINKNFRGNETLQRYYKKYKLRPDDIMKMFNDQLGLCANRACGKEIFLSGDRKDRAMLDHCHATGKVRAFLCLYCNTALGYLEKKNKVLGLTEYLQKHSDN